MDELMEWATAVELSGLTLLAYRYAMVRKAYGAEAPRGRAETTYLLTLALQCSEEELTLAEAECRAAGVLS